MATTGISITQDGREAGAPAPGAPPAATDSEAFYATVPVFEGFRSLTEPALYQPLPADWTIGVADIVQSTKAIQANRYKAVNMAGAAVIAAVKNALGGRALPYVFGGDGASFAVSPRDLSQARDALAATASWVQDELDLAMRTALVPVAAIRAAGLDVRVARFAPSPNVTYAMFAGGGLSFADAAMKRGEFAVSPAPSGTRPDLSGLSCRFQPIPAKHGLILALLVVPAPDADDAAFRAVIEATIALIEQSPEMAQPISTGRLQIRWPPAGVDLEARVGRDGARPLRLRQAGVLAWTLLYWLILRLRIRVGGFVPETYLREAVENSDFRKFDDGLRMILDCPAELADALERQLAQAAAAGIVRYGLHRQDAALMTCFTPSPMESDHVHFIDGAGGGYAAAASALKRTTAALAPQSAPTG
jgi:hypothetical protein